jgi:hypothetical protein
MSHTIPDVCATGRPIGQHRRRHDGRRERRKRRRCRDGGSVSSPEASLPDPGRCARTYTPNRGSTARTAAPDQPGPRRHPLVAPGSLGRPSPPAPEHAHPCARRELGGDSSPPPTGAPRRPRRLGELPAGVPQLALARALRRSARRKGPSPSPKSVGEAPVPFSGKGAGPVVGVFCHVFCRPRPCSSVD